MLRYKYLYLPLLFIFLLCPLLIADDGVWKKVSNPYKIGTVEEISIGYDNLQTQYIFAATSSEPGKLWRTTDSGIYWEESHYEEGYYHTRVVVQKEDFWRGWSLMIGTTEQSQAGPYYTGDKGDNWERRAAGLDHPELLHALAVEQDEDFTTAFVGGEGNSDNSYLRIAKWNTQGQNWDPSQSDLPGGEGIVHDITISEDDPDYMYCAYEGNEDGPGVYMSSNGGGNWTGMEIELPGDQYVESAIAIAVDTADPEYVYVVEKSPQFGRIWRWAETGTPPVFEWTDVTTVDYYYPAHGYLECRSIRTATITLGDPPMTGPHLFAPLVNKLR